MAKIPKALRGVLSKVIFGTILFCSAPAAAQDIPAEMKSHCADRAELLQHLAREFGESPFFKGVNTAEALIEATRSRDGRWTIFINIPGVGACILTQGTASAVAPTVPDSAT